MSRHRFSTAPATNDRMPLRVQQDSLLDLARRVIGEFSGEALIRRWSTTAQSRAWLARDAEVAPALLAVGKASISMARAASTSLGDRHDVEGLVVGLAPRDSVTLPSAWTYIEAQHPLPGPGSLAAGREAMELARRVATRGRRLLAMISGGTSSMMCAPPPEVGVEPKSRITSRLLRAGASITELNCVRSHLSLVKGGRLARLSAPAETLVLVVADVVGDDPALVGSGPFAGQETTFSEAADLLQSYGLAGEEAPVDGWLAHGKEEESRLPRRTAYSSARVEHRVLAGNLSLRQEFDRVARSLGWRTRLVRGELPSSAEAAADLVIREAERIAGLKGAIMIMGGEPTVALPGAGESVGQGGRMQHLAMLAARGIRGLSGVRVLCLATDGRDGSSENAGALVDGGSWDRAVDNGLDGGLAITLFDSERFHHAAQSTVILESTETNLRDVVLLASSDPP